jgi:IclR helix-turn-helix domain
MSPASPKRATDPKKGRKGASRGKAPRGEPAKPRRSATSAPVAAPAAPRAPLAGGTVHIPLTVAQIDRVLRQVTGERGRRGLLMERTDDLRIAVNRVLDDPEFNDTLASRSLLVGVRVWSSFPLTGQDRGVHEVAVELGMSPSTAHRYMNTLQMMGLLERTPKRRYRLPVLDEPDADHGATHA